MEKQMKIKNSVFIYVKSGKLLEKSKKKTSSTEGSAQREGNGESL